MKNLFKILVLAAVVAGCAKTEPSPDTPPAGEKSHAVSIPLSIVSPTAYNSDTEPMTRADDNTILGPLKNTYKYIICKKVGTVWYVDEIGESLLIKGAASEFDAKKSDIYDNLKLELRPGDYHIVVTANSSSVTWNPALTQGTPVKSDDGTIETPWLFQYTRLFEDGRPNYGLPTLNKDILTGTAYFTVTKTGDLHSAAPEPTVKINMSRINCWYRILLREDPSLPASLAFKMDTANTSDVTLESLDEKGFPYGVDAWGDAWYPVPAVKEFRLYVSSGYRGYMGKDNTLYSIMMPKATYFFPMLIGDKNRPEGHKYKITQFIITGQHDHMPTYYLDLGIERVYHANTYSCIVMEATDEVRQLGSDPDKLSIIAREGAAPADPFALFDAYYEWNN